MSENNNLQRMIIIPPDVFDKWKHIITEDQKLSQLDKSMKSIINNKNMNEIDKWHQYRENLLKFSFAKKNDVKFNHYVKPITSEKIIQTNRIPKFHVGQQTYQNMNDQGLQTNVDKEYILHKGDYVNKTNLFGCDTSEVFGCEGNTNLEDVNKVGDESDDSMFSIDEDVREEALLNVPKDVRIIRETKSLDPYSYRSFELSNGDVVNVPTSRTTRSMKKSAEHKKKMLSTKLKQTKISFKNVKRPHSRTRLKGAPNTSCRESDSSIPWVPYE